MKECSYSYKNIPSLLRMLFLIRIQFRIKSLIQKHTNLTVTQVISAVASLIISYLIYLLLFYSTKPSLYKFLEVLNIKFLLELLRYGRTLKYTDRDYYQQRVKLEFKNNKELEEKDIPYVLKQGRVFILSRNVE